MNHFLDTPTLHIEVTNTGIELCSVRSKITQKEYMWQGNPDIWGSHAPVLFPIIGALKNGECYYEGKPYRIPKHGLIRNSNKVKLIDKTHNSLKFELLWDEDSLALYPFKFRIVVSYTIIENTVQVSHEVINLDDKTMLYSVGGHPAFNCPINNDEDYGDYYLEFDEAETDSTWLLDSKGLVTDSTIPMIENSNRLDLHKNLFDKDALIFKNLKSRKVSLKSNASGSVLTVNFDDFDYLGVWAKPGAPFVCIEPWLGITDHTNSDQDFVTKEGLLELKPGENVTKTYSITID